MLQKGRSTFERFCQKYVQTLHLYGVFVNSRRRRKCNLNNRRFLRWTSFRALEFSLPYRLEEKRIERIPTWESLGSSDSQGPLLYPHRTERTHTPYSLSSTDSAEVTAAQQWGLPPSRYARGRSLVAADRLSRARWDLPAEHSTSIA